MNAVNNWWCHSNPIEYSSRHNFINKRLQQESAQGAENLKYLVIGCVYAQWMARFLILKCVVVELVCPAYFSLLCC